MGTSTREIDMTATKTNTAANVWQNDNGTWAHRKDRRAEFASRDEAETDLRFCEEWGR